MLGKSVRCPACEKRFTVGSVGFAKTRASQDAAETVDPEAGGTESAPPEPKTVGRFEIRGVLGRGGFGVVYHAVDTHMGRDVALKVPRFGRGERRRVKRFLAEARTAAKLRHQNIVPAFDSGEVEGKLYIAAEFVPGRALADAVDETRADTNNAVDCVRRVAEALAYAHGMGIVHRDVKPENVMLDDRGQPQLMDFGLAKQLDDDSSMSVEGSILGTPGYMAPEQARGEISAVGPHSDQYSLGVVLYELLTGEKPFRGPPHVVVSLVASDEDPPTPRSHDRSIPRDLEAICTKAMEKRPEARYANCEAFVDDLERWQSGQPTRARPIGLTGRLARWCRREPRVAGLLATVAIVTLAGFAGVLWMWNQATTNLAEANHQRTLAEDNLDEATEQRAEADEQRRRAEANATEAAQRQREAETALAEAERQRLIAEANAAEAARQRTEAVTALAEAERQRERADRGETRVVETARELEATRRLRVRTTEYAARIEDAGEALNARNLDIAQEILAELVPGEENDDLRSLEWYLLSEAARGAKGGPRKPFRQRYGEVAGEVAAKVAPIQRMTFSDDGRILAAQFAPNPRVQTLRWSIVDPNARIGATGDRLLTYRQRLPPAAIESFAHARWLRAPSTWALSSDGSRFVVEYGRGVVVRSTGRESGVQLSTDSVVGVVGASGGPYAPVAISGDGRFAAVMAASALAVFEIGTGPTQLSRHGFDLGPLHGFDFVPGEDRLVVFGLRDSDLFHVVVERRDDGLRAGTKVSTPMPKPLLDEPLVVEMSPDGRAVCAGLAEDETGYQWALADPEAGTTTWLNELLDRDTGLQFVGRRAAAFSPDGRVFAFAGEFDRNEDETDRGVHYRLPTEYRTSHFERVDDVICLVSVDDPTNVRRIHGHEGPVTGLAFAPDGRGLVSTSVDGTIRVWDVETGVQRLRLKGHTQPITAMALGRNGEVLATGDTNGTLLLWHAPRTEVDTKPTPKLAPDTEQSTENEG